MSTEDCGKAAVKNGRERRSRAAGADGSSSGAEEYDHRYGRVLHRRNAGGENYISSRSFFRLCGRFCDLCDGTDVAVSITGNAGPDASEGKPVGLVYVGVCIDGKAVGRKYLLEGNRNEIREQACTEAMKLVIGKLTNSGEQSKDLKI